MICAKTGLRWCAPNVPKKRTYVSPPPGDINAEIEIFRKDEESAQQTFFAYLGVLDLIARRPEVHAAVNRNAMFWRTAHHAMLVSSLIGLGRIFDQDSAHNLDRLLAMTARSLETLGLDALRRRKEAFITLEQAADYVKEKREITAADVRQLRKEVDAWRKIYAPVYGEIRHHLAHNKGAAEVLDALLARTNIEEMKRMFGFLHALHEALRELHLNGRNPLPLSDVTFVLPPDPRPARRYHPGEKAHREAQDVLLSMLG
ncbi:MULTISPECIES: hypothetical protein [unclassified Bradyrhizobium]|uniref:AbiU2 domain-containing protein n=1 Tax=unclassified Bradyrhizobium TaxID=2631580 RepID=UPI001FF98460|nr:MULTISPECIES: hypothetical protein [unclassified Bradyrhizobium]